ncbi:MAG: hypothetical protein KBC19_01770 [Candidatus Moranbacteria bacterium]|nr:hypothetical protein [Candidatus Moranbacteria bacterium]
MAGPWQTNPSAISAGATAGQPVQPPIPEVVDPQLFAGEVQATPYPAGRAGALTLQIPEQGYVPVLETPQIFVMVQLTPRYQGSAIAGALQPAQPMVPALAHPQEFAGPAQPQPYPAGIAGALTLQIPEQGYVPTLEAPQAFVMVQLTPRYQGSAIAGALQPAQPMVPVLAHPQEFAGPAQPQPYPAGIAGALTLQIPEQGYVPTLEAPQAFVMVQLTPRYQGSAIAGALQPAQPMVPVLAHPQEFAGPAQPQPYPAGRAGVTALQSPAQLIVPAPIDPQAFAVDEQPQPTVDTQQADAVGSK